MDTLGTFDVRVDDGGEYFVMGDEADVVTAFEGADLPEYRGLIVGAGAARVRVLGGEEVEFVELEVVYFDSPPFDQFDALFSGGADVDQGQVRVENPLEVRSIEQEPIVLVTPGPGRFLVSILRSPTSDSAIEKHRLIVCPDPVEWIRQNQPR